ncbi:MAG: tetratricopeptide repeat protein, partial [Deltaproteobacteria bacterium]|nr:tetratricopeptide repeat protein [Deltaproteobacteria bacterium]
LKTGEVKQSFKQFERAASLDPKNTDALLKSAEMYFLGKANKESRERVDQILAVDPELSAAYALLANIELREQKTDKAQDAISRALELDPSNARYHLIQSAILSARKDFDGAVKANLRAIDLDRNNIAGHNNLVGLYLSWGKSEEAEKTLKNIISTIPDRLTSHIDLARFYLNTGKIDAAEQTIKGAINIQKENADLLVFLGNLYHRSNKIDLAEEAYRQAISKSENPEDIKAILANFHFETGRYTLAKKENDELLKNNADQSLAQLVKAKLLIHAGQNTEALPIIDKTIKNFPKWGEAYYLKGLAHFNQGEILLSYNALDLARQYAPNDSQIRTLIAHHLFLRKDFPEAKQEAEKALALQNNNFRAAIILGKSLLNMGQTENALQIFAGMEQQLPDNLEILYNKAICQIAAQEFDKATETLERTLRLNQDYTPSLLALTTIMLKQNNLDSAVLRVRNQIEKSPSNPEFLLLLGNLLKKDKTTQEEALTLFKKAQDLAPEAPTPYILEAQLLAYMGKTKEAIDQYRTLLSNKPEFMPGHMALGVLLEENGAPKAAQESYRKVLAINPQFAPAANNLAWLLAQEQDADMGEALRLALVAKKQLPDDPLITDTLGMIHYKRGSYKLALTQLAFAVEKGADNPTLRYHLALALHSDGQHEKAKKELEKCLQTDNDFPERDDARKLLAKLG